jgi:ribosomal protein S1
MQARLNVGDIVQCTIKRFVYFGIFVEVRPVTSIVMCSFIKYWQLTFFSKVEGVPALVQQWEVSWDDTLDPAVSYKIGQVGSLQL